MSQHFRTPKKEGKGYAALEDNVEQRAQAIAKALEATGKTFSKYNKESPAPSHILTQSHPSRIPERSLVTSWQVASTRQERSEENGSLYSALEHSIRDINLELATALNDVVAKTHQIKIWSLTSEVNYLAGEIPAHASYCLYIELPQDVTQDHVLEIIEQNRCCPSSCVAL